MTTYPTTPEFTALWNRMMGNVYGKARQCEWHAEDDWIVVYTTGRVEGGPYDGLFLVKLYKPTGKGSKAGKRMSAEAWECVRTERHKLRRDARASAERHYYAHSPRIARKHGRA
jgi:hypothetical protein